MIQSRIVPTDNCYVFIDAPNIDGELGLQILRRRPKPHERPRWDRVYDAFECWFGADEQHFVLNPLTFRRDLDRVSPFYRFVTKTGFRVEPMPAFLLDDTGTDPVDEFIKWRMQALLESESASRSLRVVLVSDDHGYAHHLSQLLAMGVQVVVVGFRERMSPDLVQLASLGADLLDLEYDLAAFDVKLPRPLAEVWRN